jgi:electron transfer flavoprotein beta subunit
VLADVIGNENNDLILTGSRDPDQGPTAIAPMLAEFLDLPQVTSVEAILPTQTAEELHVRRRLGQGAREELKVALPAVVCLEPGLVELRIASLPALLAAQKTPVPLVRPKLLVRLAEPRLANCRPPRPRPDRLAAPNPLGSVEERLNAILGTHHSERTNTIIEGPPEGLVEQILVLLEARGFLDTSGG